MNTLLTLLLLTNLAVLVLLLVGFIAIRRSYKRVSGEYQRITNEIQEVWERTNDFFKADGDNPSEFGRLTQGIADILSRTLVMQLKATFMGMQSGAKRAENAVEADIAEAAINARSPLLGLVLNLVPGLSKSLRRNPQAVDMVLSKFIQPGATGEPKPAGNGNGPVKFNM